MWTEVDYTENLGDTLHRMANGGILLATAGADGRPNAMTIGWGYVGFSWNIPVFVTLVRPSRHTFANVEATGEFVVCVTGDDLKEAVAFCGSKSGRDVDKLAECGLTSEPAERVKAPLIAECLRCYECRVVHTNDLSDAALLPEMRAGFYSRGDLHRLYYGQILRTVERE